MGGDFCYWGTGMNEREHWDRIYSTRLPEYLSWHRAHLEKSLSLIKEAAPRRNAAIIDVGGGESTLVDDLLAHGYENLTVLDISKTALEIARLRLCERAGKTQWIEADITTAELPSQAYDVWHDRAVFHFLTKAEQRLAYVRQTLRAVKPGGHVIVSTFGPEGPTKCSGLDVVRYDAGALHGEFGTSFNLVESAKELHQTPFGTTQQFLYCYCRVE